MQHGTIRRFTTPRRNWKRWLFKSLGGWGGEGGRGKQGALSSMLKLWIDQCFQTIEGNHDMM